MKCEKLRKILQEEHTVDCLDIKKFSAGREGKYNTYYLHYMNRGTKLNGLRKVKSISHTVGYWNYHSRENTGPT